MNHNAAALAALKEMLLGQYEVRKTYDQKTAFIGWAEEYAKECGMEMTVEESGKTVRSRNLIFGDIGHAKTLITAHYDTCARMPFPNFMTPDCWPVLILTQLVLPFVFFGVLSGVCGYLLAKLTLLLGLSGLMSLLVTEALYLGFIGTLIYLMIAGPQNPHTANDNTSGTALVLLAMRVLGAREGVAYVLFDNEEKGLLGSSAFAKKHPSLQKQAFVINLDCISDGDTLLYAMAKKAKGMPQTAAVEQALQEAAARYGKAVRVGASPKVVYPSDQMAFVYGTAFAALKGKRVLYLDRIHTPKDTVFMEDNLLCLLEVLDKATA